MRQKHLLAIIGQPGAGKTTALSRALAGVPSMLQRDSAPPVTIYPGGVQLGLERAGGFGGSDAYPMNVQPVAVAFLRDAPFLAVVTEGDRLANDGFFRAVLDLGYTLQIAWIDTPNAVAAQRCEDRGSSQNLSWVVGRRTKVQNLVRRWSEHVVRIDGGGSPDMIAADLCQLPVIVRLRQDRVAGRTVRDAKQRA